MSIQKFAFVLLVICLLTIKVNAQYPPCYTFQLQDLHQSQGYNTSKEIITNLNKKIGIPLPLADSLVAINVCFDDPFSYTSAEMAQLIYLAGAYFECGKINKSKRLFNKLLEHCSFDTYCAKCAEVYNYLGNMAEVEGDWISAYYYFNKLLEWEDNNRSALNSSGLLNLGVLFMGVNNFEHADILFQRSLKIVSESISDHALEFGWLQIRLGDLRIKQGRYQEAEQYLLAANEHWKNINYPRGICYANRWLGSMYKKTKTLDAAIQFLEAVKSSEDQFDLVCRTELYLLLGELYLEQGNLPSAQSNLLKSERLATEGNYTRILLGIYDKMLAIALTLNDDAKIQNFFRLHKELSQNFSNQLKSQTIQSKSQFQKLIQKERQYNTLKQQEIYNKAQLKQQRAALVIICTLLLMATLLARNYFTYNKRNKEKNNQLLTLNQAIQQKGKELEKSAIKIKAQKKELEYQLVNKVILNGQFIETISKVKEMAKEEDFYSQKERIVKQLERLQTDVLQEDLKLQISKTNQDFFKKLSNQYPDLSQSDLRLCAFLKMNLTTKEIAKITSKTPESVKVSRSRLRKKLGLTHQKKAISVFLNTL